MKARKLIGILANAAFANPLGRGWLNRELLHGRNIAYYHWVGPCTSHYAEFYQGCSLARFREDLRFLVRHFEVVALEELMSASACKDIKRPLLAITFDDGFNLSQPELLAVFDEFKVKAATLVITSCLDNRHLMWRNQLSVIRESVTPEVYLREYNRLMSEVGYPTISKPEQLMSASFQWKMSRKDELAGKLWSRCGLLPIETYLGEHKPYFTSAGLNAWLAAGHSIGFHTRTHPRCSRLSPEEVDQEIIRPALELKQKFGLKTVAFSYPFGDRLEPAQEERAIREGGLSCALGIEGFSTAATPNHKLERQNLESAPITWGIIGKAAVRNRWFARKAAISSASDSI